MLAGSTGNGFPVPLAQRLQTLKQSAIDQQPSTVEFQHVLGTGDRPCSAQTR